MYTDKTTISILKFLYLLTYFCYQKLGFNIQIRKLQDQLKRQMGVNSGGIYTAHGLEVSDRILGYNEDLTSLENSQVVKDLKQMLSEGMK